METQIKFNVNQKIEKLIQQIEPLTKQNNKIVNITPLLDEFYKYVLQSEKYLRNGLLAINFGKAAVFLDHAFYIYSRQIDLLWDMSIDCQRRHISYGKDSAEKVEAQRKLEEKAQKGKRGRKKKVIAKKQPIDFRKIRMKLRKVCRRVLANITEFNYTDELDLTVINPDSLEAIKNLRPMRHWSPIYPERYLMRVYVENNYYRELDEDCWCNVGTAATNEMMFTLPEIERFFTYNCTENKKLDTIGSDVSDEAFQQFITKNELDPGEFTKETHQSFSKYLDVYKKSGRDEANLVEQQKKLCPRRPSVLLPRIPDHIMKQHLKQDEFTPRTSRDDSGFHEDMDTSACCDPLDDSHVASRSNVPRRRSERNSKRKIIIEEDKEPIIRKRRKRDVFKWLKTLTVSLKKFEKFFNSNYLTEDGEGEIEPLNFSSDEEDNHESFKTPESQPSNTTLNASFTSTDSGFAQPSTLSEGSFSEANRTDLNQTDITVSSTENSNTLNTSQSKSRDKVWDEQKELKEMRQRCAVWSNYMYEELKNCKQKDFDIHEFGSRIINQSSGSAPFPFRDLIKEDCSDDVARYFSAALQLSNTGNITFTNWTEGEDPPDLQIIVLSRDRHHEHLDNYRAPSKDFVQQKIRKFEMTNRDTEEPSTSNSSKKVKLTN